MMEKSSLGSGLPCSDQAYERGMHVNNPVESILTGKITGTTTFTVHRAAREWFRLKVQLEIVTGIVVGEVSFSACQKGSFVSSLMDTKHGNHVPINSEVQITQVIHFQSLQPE